MKNEALRTVRVSYGDEKTPVGVLMENPSNDKQIAFQYEESWLRKGFNLSPDNRALGFAPGLSIADNEFDGLHGVFADSLPDSWGRRLMNAYFKQQGLLERDITPLMRLAYIGDRAMGALSYFPATENALSPQKIDDWSKYIDQSHSVLAGSTEDVLHELRVAGGSAGGARAKMTILLSADKKTALVNENPLPELDEKGYSHWMIKFRHAHESTEVGKLEQIYADMARLANIDFPETALIQASSDNGAKKEHLFAVRRFDRSANHRIHVLSLAAYLNANPARSISVGYEDGFLPATLKITKSREALIKAFRMMVFNVLGHNRDDHLKNFAYVYQPEARAWQLSPAFDITLTAQIREHQMTINANPTPTIEDIGAVAKHWKINFLPIVDECQHAISQFAAIAKHYDLSAAMINQTSKILKSVALKI